MFVVQDTIRFWPLAVTMLGMSFRDPVVVSRVVRLVRYSLLSRASNYVSLLYISSAFQAIRAPRALISTVCLGCELPLCIGPCMDRPMPE